MSVQCLIQSIFIYIKTILIFNAYFHSNSVFPMVIFQEEKPKKKKLLIEEKEFGKMSLILNTIVVYLP